MTLPFVDQAYRNALHLRRCNKTGTVVRHVSRHEPVRVNYVEIVLHGTPIVRVYLMHDSISLFTGAFKTATTMRRMNHILGHGTGGQHGDAPYPTRYRMHRLGSQWYVRDTVSMTTVLWEGGNHFIISPQYNVGYATERIPLGWLAQ